MDAYLVDASRFVYACRVVPILDARRVDARRVDTPRVDANRGCACVDGREKIVLVFC